MKSVLDRFIEYVKVDTESAYNQKAIPSTEKQRVLGNMLVEELKSFGASNAYLSDNACVYGEIPANCNNAKAPVIGFSAHLDTTPELCGKDVKPRIEKNYCGGDIVLNKEKNIVMEASKFPRLKNYLGQDLVVTDGTTLLGADDKAGLAEIMTMAQYFHENPNIPHGAIQFFFPCDEEVGCIGTTTLDSKSFNPAFAYTLDGGPLGEITYECFNAAEANITIKGINIHPGLSKNQMKNSILIGKEFLDMLPDAETPGHTENYEGYYHAIEFIGEVEATKLRFYIRDHDKAKFILRKQRIEEISKFLNGVYGEGTVECKITETYQNMSEAICPCFEIVTAIEDAMKALSITPKFVPLRGGTDGSLMSFMGIPSPNICTGGDNFHGRYEYACVQSMEKISDILIQIVKSFAK